MNQCPREDEPRILDTELLQGDITGQAVDVIVNEANAQLAEPFSAAVIAISFAPVPRPAGRTATNVTISEVMGRHVIILNPAAGLFGSFVASVRSTHALVEAGRRVVTNELCDPLGRVSRPRPESKA